MNILNFFGYAICTLFLIFVCILLVACIIATVILCAVAIRNAWEEWRKVDGN